MLKMIINININQTKINIIEMWSTSSSDFFKASKHNYSQTRCLSSDLCDYDLLTIAAI